MEINKQNETFNVSDTLDNGWKSVGTITKDSDNNLSISININSDTGNVGYYSYNTSGLTNLSISAMPRYFDAVLSYSKSNVDAIMDYLANLNSTDNVNDDSGTFTASNN